MCKYIYLNIYKYIYTCIYMYIYMCIYSCVYIRGWFMVKLRHFCYLFEMRNCLSVMVQIGIPKPFAPTKCHVKHISWLMAILILLHVSLLRSAQTNPQISADFPQTKIFMWKLKEHANLAHQVILLHEFDF